MPPGASPRLRVLVVQPSLQPPGGGNAPAAWMVHALKDAHDVTVLTWVSVDVAAVNAYYGTSIGPADVTVLQVPEVLRRSTEALPGGLVLLKASWLFRRAKRLVHAYDVVVCGHNEADFGPRSIQYVHYPARLRPRPKVDLRWYHVPVLLTAYYALCERIAQLQPGELSRALTLANSTWTAALAERLYRPDRPVRVVYPPVAGAGSGRPWEDRANGFVCIGRLSPEKELDKVVAIVAGVRARVPGAHLHIVGSRGPAGYLRHLREVANERRDWLHLHEDVSRSELQALIASNRYALHGMREEHFGIAPAEAATGGCIVFVPNGGGQVDIVGSEPRLIYDSPADAVAKIVEVMEDPGEQRRLKGVLAARVTLFTSERFCEAIRGVVAEVGTPG